MKFIVTQVKNEEFRIEEWVNFHLNIGFDKIIFYVDYPNDKTLDIIQSLSSKNSNIIWFYTNHSYTYNNYKTANDYGGNDALIDGIKQSFNNGLEYIKQNYNITKNDWVAFIDVDEYIVQTGKYSLDEFLYKIDPVADRIYFTSYDMKCPLNLNESVIEQSLYRWSDITRNTGNNGLFSSRGKSMSKVSNLFQIACVHCLDSNKNEPSSKYTTVISSGGNILKEPNSVVVDVFHNEEYFKLFHYRNDSLLQTYDEFDNTALKIKQTFV